VSDFKLVCPCYIGYGFGLCLVVIGVYVLRSKRVWLGKEFL